MHDKLKVCGLVSCDTGTAPRTAPANQDAEYVPPPTSPPAKLPWHLYQSSPTPPRRQELLTPTSDWFGFSRIKKKKNPSVCPVILSVSQCSCTRAAFLFTAA